jgi:hypothetical protein
VSGSTGVADAVVLGEAVGLALGSCRIRARRSARARGSRGAGGRAGRRVVVNCAIVHSLVVEASVVTPGMHPPIVEAFIIGPSGLHSPAVYAPVVSPAAATGAKTDTANATDMTSTNHLRIVSPLFRLHIHGKDAPPRFV